MMTSLAKVNCVPKSRPPLLRIIVNKLRGMLLSLLAFLYSFQTRNSQGVLCALFYTLFWQALLSLMFTPHLLFCVFLAYAVIFVIHYNISLCTRQKSNSEKKRILWGLISIIIIQCFISIVCFSKRQAWIAYGLALFLLLFDVQYILSRDIVRSLLLLLMNAAILSICLYIAFHQDGNHKWGITGHLLQVLSDLAGSQGKNIGSIFLSIVMSLGGFLSFKDGLDILKYIPYDEWNIFTNQKLRRRKSFALVLVYGYIISISFILWRENRDIFIGGCIGLASIIFSVLIANIPPDCEERTANVIASNILSMIKYPYFGKRQIELCAKISAGDSYGMKELYEQLSDFNRIWREFSRKRFTDKQMLITYYIGNMIDASIYNDNYEKGIELYVFLLGLLCAPRCRSTNKAKSQMSLFENTEWKMYKRDAFIAGMRSGRMIIEDEKDKDKFMISDENIQDQTNGLDFSGVKKYADSVWMFCNNPKGETLQSIPGLSSNEQYFIRGVAKMFRTTEEAG